MTLNTTDLISDEIGDFWYYCATATWDWYTLFGDHLKTFGGDEYYNWPISALQNLLENVVHITQINQALLRANEVGDFELISFLIGRLFRKMLWVEPEPRDTLDDFLAKIAIPINDNISNTKVAQGIQEFLSGLVKTLD